MSSQGQKTPPEKGFVVFILGLSAEIEASQNREFMAEHISQKFLLLAG